LVTPITKEDHAAVAAAIRAAEQHTSGQIVCVLAHASSDYAYVPPLWAALVALVLPWPLIAFTQLSIQWIYLAQLILFVAATLILSWPPLRILLVPRAIRRAHAHRAAIEQFFARGVSRTRERTGVLIFVSLAERYARILADEGLAAKVRKAEWQSAVDQLTAHMRDGRIASGFLAAIERCGGVLAAHAPPTETRDELPDRLYVM
jgi:putative membrane protein